MFDARFSHFYFFSCSYQHISLCRVAHGVNGPVLLMADIIRELRSLLSLRMLLTPVDFGLLFDKSRLKTHQSTNAVCRGLR